MTKVIKIDNEKVILGLDNGSLKEVRKGDCNFTPQIGTEVEFFESDNMIIVNEKKVATVNNTNPQDQFKNGQINISINNENQKNSGMPVAGGWGPNGKGRVVNKGIYLLLAFFLGGIGGHKFYAGYTGIGILYLLLCWTFIPMIISLLEFLITLFKHPDMHGNIIV